MEAQVKEYQNKVVKVVESYKRVFPEDYQAVVDLVGKKRRNRVSKTGDMSKQSDIFDRPLLEFSTILFNAFYAKLEPENLVYLFSPTGQRWFGQTYKEFLAVEKI